MTKLKIKDAILKWDSEHPDFVGTQAEMCRRISKELNLNASSVQLVLSKLVKDKLISNPLKREPSRIEKAVVKVDNPHIVISDKANLLEREIINCLWKMIQRAGVVKILPEDLIYQTLGIFNFYQIKPLSNKWTVKRALRKQVGIAYTFYSGLLIATSIYGDENENQTTER